MLQVRPILGIVALFVVLGFIARWIARAMAWDFKLTYLAVLILASCIASFLLAAQTRRMRRQLSSVSEHNLLDLSANSEDIKFAFPTPGSRSPFLTVFVGVTTVSLPTLPLLIAPIWVLQAWVAPEPPLPQFAALALGFLAAWAWWSLAVSAWRRWAENGGMTVGEVQYHGERASILWPRGHFFEKTEWTNIRASSHDDA